MIEGAGGADVSSTLFYFVMNSPIGYGVGKSTTCNRLITTP